MSFEAKKLLLPEVILPVCVLVFIGIALRFGGFGPASRRVSVRYKSATELAKIPVSSDSYPCLVLQHVFKSQASSWRTDTQQCTPTLANDADIERYEVDLHSGRFVLRKTDLFVPDSMPLALTRCYGIWDNTSRAFGVGSNHPYDVFPGGDRSPYTYLVLVLPDDSRVHYHRISQGASYEDAVYEHVGDVPTIFQGSRILWNLDHWDLKFKDGTLYRFPEAYAAKRGAEGALICMHNPQGDEIRIARDGLRNLTRITSPHQHYIQFTYDAQQRVVEAKDEGGRFAQYGYDEKGRLEKVVANTRTLWRYTYDNDGMKTIADSTNRVILTITYSQERVSSIKTNDGLVYKFDYLFDVHHRVIESTMEDPAGKLTVFKVKKATGD